MGNKSEYAQHTLQKQVGCFNHRVVTMFADKLNRQWLQEVCFGIEGPVFSLEIANQVVPRCELP